MVNSSLLNLWTFPPSWSTKIRASRFFEIIFRSKINFLTCVFDLKFLEIRDYPALMFRAVSDFQFAIASGLNKKSKLWKYPISKRQMIVPKWPMLVSIRSTANTWHRSLFVRIKKVLKFSNILTSFETSCQKSLNYYNDVKMKLKINASLTVVFIPQLQERSIKHWKCIL